MYASGSVLAAIACVGTAVNVPNGDPTDVRTVGTGGDFATLTAALADASVVDGTTLKVISNLVTNVSLVITKKVIIDGNGFNLETTTGIVSTLVFNVQNGATIKNFASIKHLRSTNTSVEAVIVINSPLAPVYIYNNGIEIQEFGIWARTQIFIGKNTFKHLGAVTNSHRFIMLVGNIGESRIYENKFDCTLKQGTTRYSNFVYLTTVAGATFAGKLFINDNIQTSGDLRQFFLHDSSVPVNMELYIANNVFNDFNGGIGIVGVHVYNGYKTIGIYSNTQGADSAGNYKGLFFVDGSGAINENVVLEYGDNILGTTALRPDYVSYDKEGSSEVALKNTVTFVEEKEQVGLTDSLEGLGLIVQELKSKKTYIVDSEGNGIEGAGTEDNPYVLPEIPEPTPTEIITTSLKPQYYKNGWVDANNTTDETVSKLMELSDGKLVDDVDVTWTGHGLTIGDIYYLGETAGSYTNVKPTSGYVQQLFIVKDANTIHIDIEEAYSTQSTENPEFAKTVYVNGTNPNTATIFDVANPPVTNDDTLKQDSQNIYFGSDGSTWTWNGTSYTTYVFPASVLVGFNADMPAGFSVPNNGNPKITGYITYSNTAGSSWNPGTGEFTAPKTAWYDVTATIRFAAGSWVAQSNVYFNLKNQVPLNYVWFPPSVGTHATNTMNLSHKVRMAAGEKIWLDIFQNSGSTKVVPQWGGTFSVVEVK
jgi:hypothetical protein